MLLVSWILDVNNRVVATGNHDVCALGVGGCWLGVGWVLRWVLVGCRAGVGWVLSECSLSVGQ
eukprot:868580-Lingulodinium_polyedra.AAC.1